MDKIKDLEHKLVNASSHYYNGSAIMSDDEFDALYLELKELSPNNKVLADIGAEPTSEWVKAKHLIQLGSLDKVHNIDDVQKWINKSSNDGKILVCAKVDGLSIGLQYQNGAFDKGVLRGSGDQMGEDITQNVLKMRGLQKKLSNNFSGTIRGEIVLLREDYLEHFSDKKNPRNAASGICRRLDGDGCNYLTIMCYQAIGDIKFSTEIEQLEFLQKNFFVVPTYKLFSSIKEINEFYERFQSEIRSILSYDVDGLVLNVNDLTHQYSLGETNLRPKGKIAFKFAKQMVRTKVLDIEWICGSMGSITPVCHVETVRILGSDVSKASLYNIAYIEKLGLNIGAEVLICKAGEIIPRIEKVIAVGSSSKLELPNECPSCCGEVEMRGEKLCCISTDTCRAQIKGRILNYISGINALEWGDELISKLVETGNVNDIVDLYKLSIEDLMSIERMGQKSAEKCYSSLWSHNPIPLDVFLGSLSIPLVARATINLLVKSGFDSVDKIINLNIEDLNKVKGFGQSKSKALIDGLKRNKDIIDGLFSVGLAVEDLSAKKDGKLNGYKIAITGKTDIKRKDLINIINENGGEYKASATKDCSHLIIADVNSTSTKAISAKELGIKLISEDQFIDMIS